MSNKSNSSTGTATREARPKSNGKGKAQDAKQPTIEDIRKALDDQIEKFNRKAELIQNRETFANTKEKLLQYKSDIGTDFSENLDSEVLRISLENNSNYRDDTKLKIANNMIVVEFIDFAISKIDKKVAEIEKEILV